MSKKREEREKIQKKTRIYILSVVQKRPYTAVIARGAYKHEGHEPLFVYYGTGFSKVCWPDEWNAETGREIAKKKAIADITKKIQLDMLDDRPGQRSGDG